MTSSCSCPSSWHLPTFLWRGHWFLEVIGMIPLKNVGELMADLSLSVMFNLNFSIDCEWYLGGDVDSNGRCLFCRVFVLILVDNLVMLFGIWKSLGGIIQLSLRSINKLVSNVCIKIVRPMATGHSHHITRRISCLFFGQCRFCFGNLICVSFLVFEFLRAICRGLFSLSSHSNPSFYFNF